ncbi:hypothetical protein NQ318_014751 [Aromia moschata]|uniref:DNA helicase n=1 Tax=Aromia moschata TaxID=1265417 RepID=A0AAV8ZBC5_9CUCU|nr:hypothetical protein NQ318_014751 [Aromia moschata]
MSCHLTYTLNFSRFIILSCGVFMNEIKESLLALLTQQQLDTLSSDVCRREGGGPLVVYGAAGTGKTLLVLKKLDQLHRTGRLDDQNRALYCCFWPGIRMVIKECQYQRGVAKWCISRDGENLLSRTFYLIPGRKSNRNSKPWAYLAMWTLLVFTCRWAIFLRGNTKKYKHIFMDEAEAVCLSFHKSILSETMTQVYRHYHDGNCDVEDCQNASLDADLHVGDKIKRHCSKDWGELWFMIDSNQAMILIPTYSPVDLRSPTFCLSQIMRSTKSIFDVFKTFYNGPVPRPPVAPSRLPNLSLGHAIQGPPVYWVSLTKDVDETIADVIIDLCATKGVKPNDICVIPFLQSEKTSTSSINRHIGEYFVEKTFQPTAVSDAETFLMQKQLNDFLVSWALKVKGLEFTVVIMPVEDEDFDIYDMEDRRKAYVISSRCTCMLIFICNDEVRSRMRIKDTSVEYPFNIKLDCKG